MTLYSGMEGSLWTQDDGVMYQLARVKSWNYTMNQAVLDTTVLGDTDRTIIDGVRSGSGSCSLYYYNPDLSPEDDLGAGRLLKKILKPLRIADPSFDPNAYGKPSRGDTGMRSFRCYFKLRADKDLSKQYVLRSSSARELWLSTWLTSFTMTMAVGEVLSCDVTFETDGAPLDNTFSVYGVDKE